MLWVSLVLFDWLKFGVKRGNYMVFELVMLYSKLVDFELVDVKILVYNNVWINVDR